MVETAWFFPTRGYSASICCNQVFYWAPISASQNLLRCRDIPNMILSAPMVSKEDLPILKILPPDVFTQPRFLGLFTVWKRICFGWSGVRVGKRLPQVGGGRSPRRCGWFPQLMNLSSPAHSCPKSLIKGCGLSPQVVLKTAWGCSNLICDLDGLLKRLPERFRTRVSRP